VGSDKKNQDWSELWNFEGGDAVEHSCFLLEWLGELARGDEK